VGVMNFRKKVSDQLAMAQEEEQGPLIASRVRLGQILGIPGNKELLGQFVQRLDHGLISRRQDDLQFLIAYFLGQAGLIPLLGGDGYTRIVRSNYAHLKRLRPIEEIPWMWKTKGVRSGKLSTRLVSMAVFINVIGDLDDHSIEDDWDLKLVSLIKEVPDYWRSHSSLSELAQRGPFYFTSFIRVNLFINLILPHFLARLSEEERTKAYPLLRATLKQWRAEDNKITGVFKEAGANIRNAYHSQSLNYMYKNYCQHKKCVNCGIGRYIIRKEVIYDRGDSDKI